MNFLRNIWDWLKTSPRRDHKKWHPDLNPIDIHKISRDLNLKEEAHRLGSAGIPNEKDKKLTGPEAAIVFKIEEARGNYIGWGGLCLAGQNEELSRKNITKDINQAIRAGDEFERLASTFMTTRDPILRVLGNRVEALKIELERFKHDNKLDREPMTPEGNKKTLIIVMAIFAVAIEAFLNMSFFARGLSTGYLGGFTEAAIAAAVNVGLAFLSGVYGVRWIHHSNRLPQFIGVMICVITACFILTIALGIAHYRDSLAIGSENAMRLALQTLQYSPFNLKDLSSWLLFIVSVAFGGFAVFEGYKFEDPYPGYGKKYQLADEALHDYTAEISELHDYLEELKKEMLDKIEVVANKSEVSVAIYSKIIDSKRRYGHELEVAIQGAENALHALLQEFRGENCLARGDKPVPAYFNTWPELRNLNLPNFDTKVDEVNLARQRQLLKGFLGDLESIRAHIQTAFSARFDNLQTLYTQFAMGLGGAKTHDVPTKTLSTMQPIRDSQPDRQGPSNISEQSNKRAV